MKKTPETPSEWAEHVDLLLVHNSPQHDASDEGRDALEHWVRLIQRQQREKFMDQLRKLERRLDSTQ